MKDVDTMVIREMALHFIYRIRKTGVLMVGHYKGMWTRFLAEEIGIGICFAIGGFFISGFVFHVRTIVMSSVIGMGLWVGILLIFNFLRAPSSLYFEQRKEAGKYNWWDIKFSQYRFPSPSIYGIGLIVKNNKKYAIEKVSAKFFIGRLLEKKGDYSMSDHIKFFPWVLEDETLSRLPIKIESGKEAFLGIAQWNEVNTWLLHGEQVEPKVKGAIAYSTAPPLALGTYYLEFEFSGEVEGIALKPHIHAIMLDIRNVGEIQFKRTKLLRS